MRAERAADDIAHIRRRPALLQQHVMRAAQRSDTLVERPHRFAVGDTAQGLHGDGLHQRHRVLHAMAEFVVHHLHSLLGPFADADIVEEDGDLPRSGRTDPECVDVEPAPVERFGRILK